MFQGLGCNGGVPIRLNPLVYDPYLRALVVTLSGPWELPPSRRFTLGPTPHTGADFNGLPGVGLRVPKYSTQRGNRSAKNAQKRWLLYCLKLINFPESKHFEKRLKQNNGMRAAIVLLLHKDKEYS